MESCLLDSIVFLSILNIGNSYNIFLHWKIELDIRLKIVSKFLFFFQIFSSKIEDIKIYKNT